MYRNRILSLLTVFALATSGVVVSAAEPKARPKSDTPSKPARAEAPARPPKAAAPTDSGNSWYSQAVAQGRAGINVTNFWSRGPQLRAETVVGGHKIITIVSGRTYYAFDALAMSGVAIERAQEAIDEDAEGRRPFGNELEAILAQGAEKVREEVVLGTNCDVYQVTDDYGRRILWVSKGRWELPVRIEIFSRKSGDKQLTDFLDWSNGIPITDEFFVPHPAVVFENYTLQEYIDHTQNVGPVGSVPVLYADLLHGRRRK